MVSSIDEGIEHDAEKLSGELEAHLLRPGRRLAREECERIGEIGAGETEDGEEVGWQRAAIVEEGVERVGDVALVDAERAGELAERSGQVQNRVGRGIAQRS